MCRYRVAISGPVAGNHFRSRRVYEILPRRCTPAGSPVGCAEFPHRRAPQQPQNHAFFREGPAAATRYACRIRPRHQGSNGNVLFEPLHQAGANFLAQGHRSSHFPQCQRMIPFVQGLVQVDQRRAQHRETAAGLPETAFPPPAKVSASARASLRSAGTIGRPPLLARWLPGISRKARTRRRRMPRWRAASSSRAPQG